MGGTDDFEEVVAQLSGGTAPPSGSPTRRPRTATSARSRPAARRPGCCLIVEDPDAAIARAVAAGAPGRRGERRARVAPRPGLRPVRPRLGDRQAADPLAWSLGSRLVGRIVVREDPVEAAAGLGEQLLGPGDLSLVRGGGDLVGGGCDLGEQAAQLEPVLADALVGLGPGLAELLAVLLDVGLAGLGERERRAALARLGLDELLVLELLERGVDRARARAPGAL